MCGIVGYLGEKNAVDFILEGLHRLEYRGYDSAGVCLKDENGQLQIYKAVGKLGNLRHLLEGKNLYSSLAIGHTRWATHGMVVYENAHPHGDQNLAIVHNGIIENAAHLRDLMVKEGVVFQSETDSEVFFQLLGRFRKTGRNLVEATSEAFKMITGNSAFVIIDRTAEYIVAVKRGAPLVCGYNPDYGDVCISSDPYALVGHIDKFYFPGDNVISVLDPASEKKLTFLDLQLQATENVFVRMQGIKYHISEKGDFEHFMLKEIFEQPQLIRDLLHFYEQGTGKADLLKACTLIQKQVHVLGCGTARHAGLVIQKYLQKVAQLHVNVDLASEFRYDPPLLNKDESAILISQSGETADTLGAQELCAKNLMATLSLVNVEGSTLYRNSTENLLTNAGTEIGVASTKAFTCQVVVGYLLAMGLRQQRVLATGKNIGKEIQENSYHHELLLLADRIEELLSRAEEIQKLAEAIYLYKGFIYTGRGSYYPIALEGALKLKEIAYVHAEGYAAGELKHGPIALIDERMVNVAIVAPELFDKTFSNLVEVKARRGVIVAIGPHDSKVLQDSAHHFVPLNFQGLDHLAPLYVNVVLQLLSYYIAKFMGTDIDRPRNLAKSVTVE